MDSEGQNENVKKILNPKEHFKNPEVQKALKVGNKIEISPRSLVLASSIAELINKNNGAALVFDYGENHALQDSVRGIWNHKYIPNDQILDFPGEIDLSAYVNFMALSEVASKIENSKTPIQMECH